MKPQKSSTATLVLAEWYGGLKHSSSNAWEDVKTGFLESYHQLQGAFDKAAQEF